MQENFQMRNQKESESKMSRNGKLAKRTHVCLSDKDRRKDDFMRTL